MVGFGLAPRINAAGRLEQAMMAVEMLTTDDLFAAREIAGDARSVATQRRQEVERQIFDEAQEMHQGRGGPGRSPGDRAGTPRLARGRHRHRRRPPGGSVSSADCDHLAGRRDRPGLGSVDSRASTCTRRSKTAPTVCSPMAATPPRPGSSSVPTTSRSSLAGLKNGAEWLSFHRTARASLVDRRGDSAGRLEPARSSTRSKSSSRTESPIPGRCLLATGCRGRGRAPAGRRKEKPPSAPAQAGRPRLKAIAWNLAEKGRDLTAGSRLFDRLQPIDQRVERPSRGAARDQGFSYGRLPAGLEC